MVAPTTAPSRQGGLNLVEMMVTLAIIAVLGAVAMPGMTSIIASQRVKAASTDMYTSLLLARSEAIKRNADVAIAPASGGWAGGWTVAEVGEGDRLDVHGPLPNLVIQGPGALVYTGTGRLDGATAPKFEFRAQGTEQVRCVAVDLSGRPVAKRSAC